MHTLNNMNGGGEFSPDFTNYGDEYQNNFSKWTTNHFWREVFNIYGNY